MLQCAGWFTPDPRVSAPFLCSFFSFPLLFLASPAFLLLCLSFFSHVMLYASSFPPPRPAFVLPFPSLRQFFPSVQLALQPLLLSPSFSSPIDPPAPLPSSPPSSARLLPGVSATLSALLLFFVLDAGFESEIKCVGKR